MPNMAGPCRARGAQRAAPSGQRRDATAPTASRRARGRGAPTGWIQRWPVADSIASLEIEEAPAHRRRRPRRPRAAPGGAPQRHRRRPTGPSRRVAVGRPSRGRSTDVTGVSSSGGSCRGRARCRVSWRRRGFVAVVHGHLPRGSRCARMPALWSQFEPHIRRVAAGGCDDLVTAEQHQRSASTSTWADRAVGVVRDDVHRSGIGRVDDDAVSSSIVSQMSPVPWVSSMTGMSSWPGEANM